MVSALLEKVRMFDMSHRLFGTAGPEAPASFEVSELQTASDSPGDTRLGEDDLEQLAQIAHSSIRIASLGPRLAALGAQMKEQADAQSRRAAAIANTMEGLTRNLENAVAELRASSSQVDQALATVSRIAAHTRIISLNASIEAARAGAQGRAFAVVVEEVQRLADNTGSTTRAIEGRMHDMQASIVRVATVAGGAQAAASSDGVRSVESVNSEVHGMARSARDQLSGVQELHTLGDSVNALAESLLLSVGRFRFDAHRRAALELGVLPGQLLDGPLERGRCERLLEGWLARHPAFELVYLTDKDGRQFVDNLARQDGSVVHDPSGLNRDWSQRPWLLAALEHSGLHCTDIYRSSATGDFCFTVAVALRNENAALLGVLAADVNFQRLLAK